ncbi:hypothetical protein B4V02_21645 [Paenibacillus kribbensis]|uniref:Uncharacterized protein n=2 Tax=Paenibacillus kribbensis TaxID=172713 RepID=A0A222WT91_9BACL|nr:hypothetical protein B4V02_21645 [Paenibacillus kribbensis]
MRQKILLGKKKLMKIIGYDALVEKKTFALQADNCPGKVPNVINFSRHLLYNNNFYPFLFDGL